MKDTHEAIADFGKVATALHTLIHKSVDLTEIQVIFIARQLDSLGIVLRLHYPKNTRGSL
jgi:chemotaxis protein CheY-P-specific phosphatase CheC